MICDRCEAEDIGMELPESGQPAHCNRCAARDDELRRRGWTDAEIQRADEMGDPLNPCMSCDGRDGHHTAECYFAPHEPQTNDNPTGERN